MCDICFDYGAITVSVNNQETCFRCLGEDNVD